MQTWPASPLPRSSGAAVPQLMAAHRKGISFPSMSAAYTQCLPQAGSTADQVLEGMTNEAAL
jgi:hypothetical protein